MDPIVIPALVTSAWTLLQPYLPLIATKAAKKIGEGIPVAVVKVWTAIKEKFDTKDAAQETLQDLLKNPDDGDFQAAFRAQLKKVMIEDETFVSELAKLLEAVGDSYKAELHGDGAISQGDGAIAIGKGGTYIGGNVKGSNIITGNINKVKGNGK